MGWLDKVLRKGNIYSGNTRVVSEQEAGENPYPNHARIVAPDSDEGRDFVEDLLAVQRNESCGHCDFFNLEAGQAFLHDGKSHILPRLLQEYELESIGGHLAPEKLGLCEQWTSRSSEPALVDFRSPPKVSKWYTDVDCPYYERDFEVPCPYFKVKRRGLLKFFKKD